MTEYFWRPKDLAEVLECSMSKAYKLVQKWNGELKERGYETIAGRIPKQYAIDRLGLEARGNVPSENHQGVKNHLGGSAGVFRGKNNRQRLSVGLGLAGKLPACE